MFGSGADRAAFSGRPMSAQAGPCKHLDGLERGVADRTYTWFDDNADVVEGGVDVVSIIEEVEKRGSYRGATADLSCLKARGLGEIVAVKDELGGRCSGQQVHLDELQADYGSKSIVPITDNHKTRILVGR